MKKPQPSAPLIRLLLTAVIIVTKPVNLVSLPADHGQAAGQTGGISKKGEAIEMKRKLVLSGVVAFFFGAISVLAHAEPFSITVPGKGLQLSFDVPVMDKIQGQVEGDRYKFFGQSTDKGIWVSFHAEPWTTGGNKECREAYWAVVKDKNKLIKEDTTKVVDTDSYSMVYYLMDGEYEGQKVKSANASFYFVQGNSCYDVHVSKFPFAEGDEKIVTGFGKNLKYKAVK
jgi:hypothetical protein